MWLDDDNHIQDPSLAEETIAKADVVQDYVKACRKFNKVRKFAYFASGLVTRTCFIFVLNSDLQRFLSNIFADSEKIHRPIFCNYLYLVALWYFFMALEYIHCSVSSISWLNGKISISIFVEWIHITHLV